MTWSGRVASTTSFGDYVTTSGVPSDPVSVGQSVKFRIASTFTPSLSKFTWAVLSESKGVVATGLAAQNTDVLFQVTESMKPRSVLLVYSPWDGSDTDDTNVVACARSFEVLPASAHAFPQNLTVSRPDGDSSACPLCGTAADWAGHPYFQRMDLWVWSP